MIRTETSLNLCVCIRVCMHAQYASMHVLVGSFVGAAFVEHSTAVWRLHYAVWHVQPAWLDFPKTSLYIECDQQCCWLIMDKCVWGLHGVHAQASMRLQLFFSPGLINFLQGTLPWFSCMFRSRRLLTASSAATASSHHTVVGHGQGRLILATTWE